MYNPPPPPFSGTLKPVFPLYKNLIVSDFQRCASTLSLRQSLYLAFKMHTSTIISCIPLLARRRACKLLLTPLLSTFFLHGRTDGWSNTASPTTPPYLYIVHLVKFTQKCPLSLGFRDLMSCFTLFYSITLQLSYIVEFFDPFQMNFITRVQYVCKIFCIHYMYVFTKRHAHRDVYFFFLNSNSYFSTF